ncbi:MAG: DNA primase [Candidatus Ryanbacteria bacterium RIFCSPHIGHO2_01_FULL_48_27]|uniref:DNA primase n=1 Tax=Candidatus Ryanbacteria bacterium RIFCSPHIGHO2_01_FULL_48_27 TaxID=1802115 RepID=A0A1G2G4S9_9BACT|nr:MAG: DNA primase [Candidatus Ryanbacteria bacterium RIFCSPHIGHO2_01_FULL_48_27]
MPSPVEQIKARLSVADVVGSYLKLVRAGANFKAVCPFHNEKTPSFYVSPARDVWHCFGCGKGGDQFRFVMDIEGVDFKEALDILAKRASVELVYEDPRERDERLRLFAILEETAKFYELNLSRSATVRDYLVKRGVSEESVKSFRLGFSLPEATGWRTLLEHLQKKGFIPPEIEKVGLLIKNPKAQSAAHLYYDRFRNRIIFPIADFNGRIIGFGGRIFGNATDTVAKYINSPQTVLYDKSRVLYAFDKAKLEVRKSNTAILVEGYMDALMVHQAGTTNAVAVSGTALTPYQLQGLKRLCDKLLMSFDMDEAGESATRRSIDMALEAGFDVKVIAVKEKDPADVIKENPAVWLEAVEQSKDVISFFLERSLEKFDARTIEGKRSIARSVLPLVAKIPQEIDKAHWVAKIAQALGIKDEAVWQDLKKIKSPHVFAAARQDLGVNAPPQKSRLQVLEERLLGLLFARPLEVAEKLNADMFSLPAHKKLYTDLAASERSEEGYRTSFANMPPEYQTLANRFIFEAEVTGFAGIDEEVGACVQEIEREQLKGRLEGLSDRIRKAELSGNTAELGTLVAEFSDASRRLASS